MKKTLLLLLLPLNLCAQTAMWDAIRLAELLDEKAVNKPKNAVAAFRADQASYNQWYAILAPYTGLSTPEQEDFFDAFFQNPFLSDQEGALVFLPNQIQASNTPDADAISFLEIERNKVLPAPRPLNFVTNLADGFARFFIKRTKEELTLSFFRKFKNELESNTILQLYFPATRDVLFTIDPDIYQFQAYAELLRDNFRYDLKALPKQLTENIQKDKIKINPEIKIALSDALVVAKMANDGANFIELLDYMSGDAAFQNPELVSKIENAEVRKALEDIASGFRLARFISNSLRNPEVSGQEWLAPELVRRVFSDKRTMYLYLGLLWMQAGEQMLDGKPMRELIGNLQQTAGAMESVRREIVGFAQEARELRKTLDSLSSLISDAKEADFRQLVVHHAERIVEYGLGFGVVLLQRSDLAARIDSKFFRLLRQANALQYNVRKEHYVAAVGNMTTLLGLALGDKFDGKNEIMRYGAFIATVAEAKNSQDVQYAMELFSLPPGSSSLKKQADFSIALNGYTGLGASSERIVESATPDRPAIAVAAPIGIGANWGLKKGGSLGIFVPVIDIGAVTAFRLKDPQTSDLPELNWNNLWAPGAYLTYGFFNYIPVTVGAGWQIGPNLRSINKTAQTDIQTVRASRFQVFLSVDIPVVHFYTK